MGETILVGLRIGERGLVLDSLNSSFEKKIELP